MTAPDTFEDLTFAYINSRPNGFTLVPDVPFTGDDPQTARRFYELVGVLEELSGIGSASLDLDIETPWTITVYYDGTRPNGNVLQDVVKLTGTEGKAIHPIA